MSGTYLDGILAAKRAELAKRPPPSEREVQGHLRTLPPGRDLARALRAGVARTGVAAIAEFKRASPSEGTIRDPADPEAIARDYVDAGAAAISVLTDRHFQGSFDDLRAVRRAVDVPILCKDFILDRRQLVEARMAGADAALLIVAALEPPHLRTLIDAASELGLQVLCEAHDEHEIDRAMAAGATIVGVNARDLRTFAVDQSRHLQMRRLVPRSHVYVAESGIRAAADLGPLRQAGVDAVLVGTHLMRAERPGAALIELLQGAA
jgi:indole-3-glycerol phosphate synthase